MGCFNLILNSEESMNKSKDQLIRELQDEIRSLKSILTILPGFVYWKDNNGYYLGCNQNLATFLNLPSPEAILNKNDIDLLGQELGSTIQKIDLEIIKTNRESDIEEHGPDGTIYLTKKTPFHDQSGKTQGILGVSLDITDRKKMEFNLKVAKQKAEAANRAKSRFLAMVSHELRTPLTSIIGFANLLEDNIPAEKREDYLKHIIHSSSYLLSLVNTILDYSRLETNNLKLADAPINLKKLLHEVVGMLDGAAKLKNISVFLNYPNNIPEDFITDSRIIRQVLVNLLGNAIKFTKKGSVSIHVSLKKIFSNKARLEIAIEDTGIGISTKEQKLIFKKFYQGGNLYTKETDLTGTGLGLAIVRKLLKLLKSKIQLKSKMNQGSTFYFTVDFALAPIENLVKHAKETNIFYGHIKKNQKILLVEDNPLIQIIHKKMLEELGCEVIIADRAEQAMTMLRDPFNLIFVDIGLPEIDGFELIKVIREQQNTQNKLPIVALTGYSENEDKQRCLDAGANEVVIKPVSQAALKQILATYC